VAVADAAAGAGAAEAMAAVLRCSAALLAVLCTALRRAVTTWLGGSMQLTAAAAVALGAGGGANGGEIGIVAVLIGCRHAGPHRAPVGSDITSGCGPGLGSSSCRAHLQQEGVDKWCSA
jgi:hypothetical protein